MKYSTFNRTPNDALLEPMFFGQNVNVSRFDQQKYTFFEKLTERQLSFFWRPEEIDATQMMSEFNTLTENEQHIFISNLKYQTLLDSVQGRSPNVALLPIVSLPELETWVETWSFFETIHSRSYTHIIRNSFTNPAEVLDDIVRNNHIIARAKDIARYYDDLIIKTQLYQSQGEGNYKIEGQDVKVNIRELKKSLWLCMNSIYALEAIRFYVSFACSFAFGERELLDANARIIKLISRDEALHMSGTQFIINTWKKGIDDPEMGEIVEEMKEEGRQIFLDTMRQEIEWAEYLFEKGSMLGLNKEILTDYLKYISAQRLDGAGFKVDFDHPTSNPIPWINNWLNSDNVQVAPQEVELTSYLVGQVDSNVDMNDFKNFKL